MGKVTEEQLHFALMIMSGRVIAPTIQLCDQLGFSEEDYRSDPLYNKKLPPHISRVKMRCEEVVFDAIKFGISE